MRLPTLDVEKYNGSTDFDRWLKEIERKFDSVSLNNNEKLLYLPNLLTGKAKRKYNELDACDLESYDKLTAALKTRLGFNHSDIIRSAVNLNIKNI